jgi:hypothetical protein
MQKQVRALLIMVTRLVHEKTAATAAAARLSAAGEALREHRLPRNTRGGLADGEVLWAPQRPLATILADAAETVQPRVALGSNGAAPEYEALGELGLLQGDRKAAETEEQRAGAATVLVREASSAEPEPSFARGALIGLKLLLGDGQAVESGAEPENG